MSQPLRLKRSGHIDPKDPEISIKDSRVNVHDKRGGELTCIKNTLYKPWILWITHEANAAADCAQSDPDILRSSTDALKFMAQPKAVK